jgi:uncharacterized coiled-coil DUF342 family protein
MLAIKELADKLNVVGNDVAELKTEVSNLNTRVANLESEQKIMREEMNQNFRKLDKKISIFADDLIDVRSDIKLLEEKIG